MRGFVIFADSTCDLGKDLRVKYNIDYVPMNYVVDDEEYVASLDWESHSAKEFYDIMRGGKRVFTTQVPKNRYIERFTETIEQGKDVLYIGCSSALSGSVNTAKIVAKELLEKYPQAKIFCIDSLCSSLGQGHLAIVASNMRSEGKSIDETAEFIESIKLKMNQRGTVESMNYLARAGRIKASKAFFGNLFGVKPLIISDRIGQNYAYKKVKGMNNARLAIAQDIKDVADGVYDMLYISHADCEEEANKIKDAVLSVAPFKEVYMNTIAPIVGASVGPGTVIVYCYGKEVTIEGKE